MRLETSVLRLAVGLSILAATLLPVGCTDGGSGAEGGEGASAHAEQTRHWEGTPSGVGGGAAGSEPSDRVPTLSGSPPGCPPESVNNPVRPDETVVPGATPDICRPGWFEPYRRMELTYPVFRGKLAGIRFGELDEVTKAVEAAAGAELSSCGEAGWKPLESAAETVLAINPVHLPPATEFVQGSALWCGEAVVSTEAEYRVGSLAEPLQYGGVLTIRRQRVSEPVSSTSLRDVPGRWYETRVAGNPAAVARPLVPEVGYGESEVHVYANGVLTIVSASGITERELLAVAESLFED